jgi:small subunit ribosomal protein S17
VTEERENREEATAGLEAENLGDSTAGSSGPVLDQDPGPVQQADPIQRETAGRGTRKERVGLVVSDKPEKTAVVSVETLVQHPMYKKRVRRSKRFMVHDERNEARVGDTVRIVETRPISARKRWRLTNIISRAQ